MNSVGIFLVLGLICGVLVKGHEEYPVKIPAGPSGKYVAIQSENHPNNQWPGPDPGDEFEHEPHEHHENEKLEIFTKFQKFGFPYGCASKGDDIKYTDCDFMVSITMNPIVYPPSKPGYAHFKLSGKLDKSGLGYVAVGLSEDTKMGDDHIVECIKTKDGIKNFHSWSQYQKTPIRLKDDITLIDMKDKSVLDNIITCEFTRPLITKVKHLDVDNQEKVTIFDLTKNKYYVLMVTGQLKSLNSEEIGFHGPEALGHVYISSKEQLYRSSSSCLSAGITVILLQFMLMKILN